MDSQTCYLCNQEKNLEEFIQRKDGIYYRMCKTCNEEVQKKKFKVKDMKTGKEKYITIQKVSKKNVVLKKK